MKIKNKKISNRSIFFGIAFLLLFLSYFANAWKVTPSEYFYGFERYPEGLVVGRLIKAEKDGVLSAGGYTGIAYNSDPTKTEEELVSAYTPRQHDIYLTNKTAPDSFHIYPSQIGGQAITYSVIQKISPFSHVRNMQLFRIINSALTAFCFILFLGWGYRNFGFKSSLIAFILLLFSPWINNFAHNLWWSLWSFFLPFLCLLFLLERRDGTKYRTISNVGSYILIFTSVFIKCFFSGYEFITSNLFALICPVFYYTIVHRQKIMSFIVMSLKVGITSVLAVLASMFVLVLQMRSITGSFSDGINHILLSYSKRTTSDVIAGNKPAFSYSGILEKYFGGDAFALGYFTESSFQFHFGYLVLIILICGIILFVRKKRYNDREYLKNKALILTTLFSILAPLSWFIVFKQHASEHPHLDYIVWYMPFLLFGFLLIGRCISSFLSKNNDSVSFVGKG